MKTTDFTLAEIDDYIAVRKLVTRKEMRLAHEYEKTLEWRHMEKLHALREAFDNDRERKRFERGGSLAVGNTSFWQRTASSHPSRPRRIVIMRDSDKRLYANGVEIPERLELVFELAIANLSTPFRSRNKCRRIAIEAIMRKTGKGFNSAQSQFDRHILQLIKHFQNNVRVEA